MKWFCLSVGAMDAVTGLLLMAVPEFTLMLMGIQAPVETMFLRWVGVFVFSVGTVYGLPFLTRTQGLTQKVQLITILAATMIVRTCVALFVITAVSLSALAPAWLTVALTDGVCAVVQLELIRNMRHD